MYQMVHNKRPTRVVDWLNARLTVNFILILVVFFLGIATSLYAFNLQRHLDDQKVVLHEDTDGILQAMIDQQSGLRAYIGSNNAVYLAPFRQGRSTYLTSVQDLATRLQSSAFRHAF